MKRVLTLFLFLTVLILPAYTEDFKQWRLQLEIDVPGMDPNAIQWSLFEKDPNIYFLKDLQPKIDEINHVIDKEPDAEKKKLIRNLFIIRQWESIFSHISGDKVQLLAGNTKSNVKFRSKSLNSRKWITTKMIVVDGQVLCWRIGVKPEENGTVVVKLNKENAYNFKKAWPIAALMRDFRAESLIQLIQRNDKEKMREMVSTFYKADQSIINKNDEHSINLLMWTTAQDDLRTFKYLVELGADLSYRNKGSWDIRDMAALLGSKDIFRTLVSDLKFSPLDNNEMGMAPIHLAALTGQLELLKILVEEYGANINQKSIGGYTPLHFASAGQYPEVMEYLIQKGADVNSANRRGQTALLVYANPYILHGNLPGAIFYFYYLKAKGELNYYNFNPFRANEKSSLKILLNAGADINHQDNNGWSILHYGIWMYNQFYIKFLLEQGADKSVRTSKTSFDLPAGSSPYDYARIALEKFKRKNTMINYQTELEGMLPLLK